MDKHIYGPDQRALSDLLRRTRLEGGLRQQDVAERIGEPQSFVSRYETGQRRLDVLELRVVCRAVGVSLPEFVARLEESLGGPKRRRR